MWTKIITDNCNTINQKIDQIAQEIDSVQMDENSIGLMSGEAGKALFLAYYGQYSGNEQYIEKSSELLFDIIHRINKHQNLNPLFSNGITGVLWVIRHLVENDFIECDFKNMFGEIENYLSTQMMLLLDKKANYDFLHGSLGIANYLLKNDIHHRFLFTHIQKLEEIGIKDINSIHWKSSIITTEGKEETVINLGLSHGLSSIVAYLNKCSQVFEKNERITSLIEKSIHFILNHKQDLSCFRSYFPNWVSEDPEVKNSGLRWCYGDLGIAYTLYKSSLLLQDHELEKFSLDVLLETCKRKDHVKEGIIDAGLCHGYFGIVHIYNRLFHYSSNLNFKEAAQYWCNKGLHSATKTGGIAGFLSHNHYSGWSKNVSFLEGVSGIGLSLIATVSEMEPKWDECLLLS